MCRSWHYDDWMVRRLKHRLVAILLGAACTAASGSARGEGDFQLSFAAGSTDAAGHFTGGTELRVLAVHGGKLYAGNGYWEDRPGPEGAARRTNPRSRRIGCWLARKACLRWPDA